MKSKSLLSLCLLLVLIFPSINYGLSNIPVANWVRHTLLHTFSLSYPVSSAEMAERQENFLPEAWDSLMPFLLPQKILVNRNLLHLHPVLLGPTTIVKTGVLRRFRYWQVTQVLSIPELALKVNFSLIVTKANTFSGFVVQNLKMTTLSH